MTQQARSVTSNYYPPLVAIKGGLSSQSASLNKLTYTAWIIAYTALWNGEIFSAAEVETTKKLIGGYIINEINPAKAYTQLVQRILLARAHVKSHPGKQIPLPSQWFDMQNGNGFAQTEKWYNAIQLTRQSLPLHKLELKAFAEAMEEITDEATAANFHYWRSYFVDRNCQALLNLFLSAVANYLYLEAPASSQ